MAWRRSIWRVIADWWSFRIETIKLWLFPPSESTEDRLIREDGERLRRLFPGHYQHERSARTYGKHFREVLASRAANDR
jgi:hypothetical protein